MEGMRTLGFKQRWLRMNKEWVMDELMSIWQQGNEKAAGNGKRHSGRGAERVWLREWDSGGGKEALLKQIATSLGLEENWDRHEEEGGEVLTGMDTGAVQSPAAMTYRAMSNNGRTARRDAEQQEDEEAVGDDNLLSDREGEAMDDQLPSPVFSPPARQRTARKRGKEPRATATTTSAIMHRKHLLSLSHRYFLSHLPQRCSHCSKLATPTSPIVFLLSFPLSTILRRFYARRRRQAAVTARTNGQQRLNRELVYERVSREQWAQWLEQELEWAAVCVDCADTERAKRRQGEVTVFDVKKEMERMKRRKQRRKKDKQGVSDSSEEDEEAAEQTARPRSVQVRLPEDDISDDDEHDGEQADTAAYFRPALRDDAGKASPHQQAGEYSVSASSVRADEREEAEEAESVMPAEVREFMVQWMDKAQAVLDRRAAVQQQDEQVLSERSRSRAASVSRVSISADSQVTHRASISSSSEESGLSGQLHREDVEHGLVGLGRLDISSDSDSDGAVDRGRGTSLADVVTRDEDDYTAAVSRQPE